MSNTTEIHPRVADVGSSPAVAALRGKLLNGLAAVPEFAEAINRSERTVYSWIANGMPTTYIGRTPYIDVDPAREWLLTRRSRAPARGRGRPRKVA